MYSDSRSNQRSNQQQPKLKIPVYLNIYNFWTCFNRFCQPLGIGVYHTGIQFYDDEYMYFGFQGEETGVGFIEPFQAAYQFKEQQLMGYSPLTFFQFDQQVLDPLRLEFTGNKYDLLGNNCNHFARRLAKELKMDQKFPPIVFRITDCCNLFRCCIPQCILNGRLDWFDWSSDSSKEDEGYFELQESVKEQFDMKMLKEKQREKPYIKIVSPHKEPIEKNSAINTPTSFNYKKQQIQRLNYVQPHHNVLKNTTLRKGIQPHLENAHQRASMNQLPNVPPRVLGHQSVHHQNPNPKPSQLYKQYPGEDVKIYSVKKINKQIHFQQ